MGKGGRRLGMGDDGIDYRFEKVNEGKWRLQGEGRGGRVRS